MPFEQSKTRMQTSPLFRNSAKWQAIRSSKKKEEENKVRRTCGPRDIPFNLHTAVPGLSMSRENGKFWQRLGCLRLPLSAPPPFPWNTSPPTPSIVPSSSARVSIQLLFSYIYTQKNVGIVLYVRAVFLFFFVALTNLVPEELSRTSTLTRRFWLPKVPSTDGGFSNGFGSSVDMVLVLFFQAITYIHTSISRRWLFLHLTNRKQLAKVQMVVSIGGTRVGINLFVFLFSTPQIYFCWRVPQFGRIRSGHLLAGITYYTHTHTHHILITPQACWDNGSPERKRDGHDMCVFKAANLRKKLPTLSFPTNDLYISCRVHVAFLVCLRFLSRLFMNHTHVCNHGLPVWVTHVPTSLEKGRTMGFHGFATYVTGQDV